VEQDLGHGPQPIQRWGPGLVLNFLAAKWTHG
jgi:hypothetical protein